MKFWHSEHSTDMIVRACPLWLKLLLHWWGKKVQHNNRLIIVSHRSDVNYDKHKHMKQTEMSYSHHIFLTVLRCLRIDWHYVILLRPLLPQYNVSFQLELAPPTAYLDEPTANHCVIVVDRWKGYMLKSNKVQSGWRARLSFMIVAMVYPSLLALYWKCRLCERSRVGCSTTANWLVNRLQTHRSRGQLNAKPIYSDRREAFFSILVKDVKDHEFHWPMTSLSGSTFSKDDGFSCKVWISDKFDLKCLFSPFPWTGGISVLSQHFLFASKNAFKPDLHSHPN